MLRPTDPAAQALREQERGQAVYWMVWIDAIHRQTRQRDGIGFWTGGPATRIPVVDMWSGQSEIREFLGAGGLLDVRQIQYSTGTEIRPARLTLSALNEEVVTAFMAYQLRGARVQIWLVTHDPETGLRVGFPERAFKGYANVAHIRRPPSGQEAVIEMTLVSTARNLTITSRSKKSNPAQWERDPNDNFRKDKARQRDLDLAWGEHDKRSVNN